MHVTAPTVTEAGPIEARRPRQTPVRIGRDVSRPAKFGNGRCLAACNGAFGTGTSTPGLGCSLPLLARNAPAVAHPMSITTPSAAEMSGHDRLMARWLHSRADERNIHKT